MEPEIKVKIYSQSPGETGTFDTIQVMRSLVNESQISPEIRDRAAMLVESCNRERCCEDSHISAWVRNIMQFVDDPPDFEAIFHPKKVEERIKENEKNFLGYQPIYGDCDDMATYLAALLKAIGHSPKFRVLTRDANEPLHHVVILCHYPYIDPTVPVGTSARVGRFVDIDI